MSSPLPLFKVVNGLRYFGVGCKVTRDIYKKPNTYWLLTKVKLSKDQNHGRAWGQLVWNGRPSGTVQRITCGLKSQWSLVNLPDYTTNFEEQMEKELEAQAKESE